MIRIFGSLKDEPKIQSATASKIFQKVSFRKSHVVSIERNPEVAAQPLFFGKLEGNAYEESTLFNLS